MVLAITLFLISAVAAAIVALLAMILFGWDLRWVPNPTFPGWLPTESLFLAPLLGIAWSIHMDGGVRSWLLASAACWLLGILCYAIAQWSTRAVEGIGSFRIHDRAVFIGSRYTFSRLLMWLFPVVYAALALLAFEFAAREELPVWVAWGLAYVSLLHGVERLRMGVGLSPIGGWPWS